MALPASPAGDTGATVMSPQSPACPRAHPVASAGTDSGIPPPSPRCPPGRDGHTSGSRPYLGLALGVAGELAACGRERGERVSGGRRRGMARGHQDMHMDAHTLHTRVHTLSGTSTAQHLVHTRVALGHIPASRPPLVPTCRGACARATLVPGRYRREGRPCTDTSHEASHVHRKGAAAARAPACPRAAAARPRPGRGGHVQMAGAGVCLSLLGTRTCAGHRHAARAALQSHTSRPQGTRGSLLSVARAAPPGPGPPWGRFLRRRKPHCSAAFPPAAPRTGLGGTAHVRGAAAPPASRCQGQ